MHPPTAPTQHRRLIHALVHDDHGQATTEYALVLLGAALVALMVVAWAGSGGASGKIGQLFDNVIDSITSRL